MLASQQTPPRPAPPCPALPCRRPHAASLTWRAPPSAWTCRTLCSDLDGRCFCRAPHLTVEASATTPACKVPPQSGQLPPQSGQLYVLCTMPRPCPLLLATRLV